MSRPSPSLAAGLLDLFVAPASLFRALPDRRWWGWAAFILIAVSIAVATYVFFSPMSPEWIVEQQIQQMGDRMSEADIERIRPQLVSMAPHTAIFSALGGVFFLGLLVLLVGSVYMLLSRVATSGPKRGWGAWLRFTTWTQLPGVAYAIGLLVMTLVAGSPDQSMEMMGYASLNAVLGLPPGHRWYNLAVNLGLFTIWSMALSVIGFRIWTGASVARSVVLGLLPWVLVYGIWALFS